MVQFALGQRPGSRWRHMPLGVDGVHRLDAVVQWSSGMSTVGKHVRHTRRA